MAGAIQGITRQCTSLNSVFYGTEAPYPRTMSAQPTVGIVYPSSLAHVTPVHRVLHSPHQPSIARPFSGYGPPEHQRQSAYHQGNDLTLARPLTINTIAQMLPSSTVHAEWQQPVMSIPEQSSVLFNGALAVCSSEGHRSVLHKHLVPNNITFNNRHHSGGVQTLPDHSTASQLDDHTYEHVHDSYPPPTSLVQRGGTANQSNEQIIIEGGSDANTMTPTLPQDHNGIPSVQQQPHVHSQDSISNEIQNLRVPSPEYLEVVNGFFAQWPPHIAFSTSVPSTSSNEERSPNDIPHQHHSLYTPSQIPTAQHNEWNAAVQQPVECVSRTCAQDTLHCSASHQGEAELYQHNRSESTPSSEEYLIERNPFDEGPDDGSLLQEAGEAGSWTPAQPHQPVSLANSNVSRELPPSNEGDDLTKSSQPSVHPGDITENHLPREDVERGSKRKHDAEVASERSQPQRRTKCRQDSGVSSPSGSASSTSAQGNIQKKERKIYTLTESVGDNFRYQRVPRPENQGGGFTESYQSSTNPEGGFTFAEHRPQEPSTESKRKREEEVASETSQPERPVKRIRNSSASSASSSSSHSSSSSPPMPSQEAVAEDTITKRKKKLLRDKMDGPFWLQRIPEQEKELVHIAETVSPAEQVPESEENEN